MDGVQKTRRDNINTMPAETSNKKTLKATNDDFYLSLQKQNREQSIRFDITEYIIETERN